MPHLVLMALTSLSLRRSALEFCKEITAHTAAGIHPMSVICRIKQKMPVNIFPRSRKERNGKKMAIKVMRKIRDCFCVEGGSELPLINLWKIFVLTNAGSG